MVRRSLTPIAAICLLVALAHLSASPTPRPAPPIQRTPSTAPADVDGYATARFVASEMTRLPQNPTWILAVHDSAAWLTRSAHASGAVGVTISPRTRLLSYGFAGQPSHTFCLTLTNAGRVSVWTDHGHQPAATGCARRGVPVSP